MQDLNKQIEEYTDELFAELGPVTLPEERKADLFARIEEHLHAAILRELAPTLSKAEHQRLKTGLEQGDYAVLKRILKTSPEFKKILDDRLDIEFRSLKLIISEEQKNADKREHDQAGGGGAEQTQPAAGT